MPQPVKVGFLGAGKMATAMAGGMIEAGVTDAASVTASCRSSETRDAFKEAVGVLPSLENGDVVIRSEVVFIAVKPHQFDEVLLPLKSIWPADSLIVSVAAGVSLERLATLVPDRQPLIRVMPNTPLLVGCGASTISRGPNATDQHVATVRRLLEPVGMVAEVPEISIDGVIGVSGSGPAYCYQFIEALSDGGVRQGLPRELATRLAAQTLLGAAQMVLETGTHPGKLKDAVTSPGGTTIAALHALERGGLRGTVMDAVEAAAERSREMSQN